MQKLITDKVEVKLNEQIKVELTASHVYKAMAVWADKEGLLGIKKYFLKQEKEEQSHAQRVMDYIVDRNGCVTIPDLAKQGSELGDLGMVLNLYMQHELQVENSWRIVVDLTKLEKDSTTFAFAQWFINEQIDEIATVGDLIATYTTLSKGGQIGYACGQLNEIMEEM